MLVCSDYSCARVHLVRYYVLCGILSFADTTNIALGGLSHSRHYEHRPEGCLLVLATSVAMDKPYCFMVIIMPTLRTHQHVLRLFNVLLDGCDLVGFYEEEVAMQKGEML